MVGSEDPLPSYPWQDEHHRRWAEEETRQFVEAADQLEKADPSFVTGPPTPVPELRVVPRV